MNRILAYLIIIVTSLAFCSCSSFLEEYSQNQTYAKDATDLNELLIGNGYMETYSASVYSPSTMIIGAETAEPNFPWIHVMDDDVQEFFAGGPYSASESTPINLMNNFFTWQQRPFVGMDGTTLTDYNWTRFYKHIAATNAIIFKAQDLRGKDTDAALNKVTGEALFLRAGYYFLLVNIYGKPYIKETAAMDSGVPLKITPDIEDKYYSRATVGAVYNQIVADLKLSAECLDGIIQPSIYRANQTAAYAFLSRVYLYMEEYQLALDAANSAISSSSAFITDLNSYVAGSSFTNKTSPETIFSQGGYAMNLIQVDDQTQTMFANMSHSYKVSDELLSLYDKTDLRVNAFFISSTVNNEKLAAKLRTPTDNTTLVSDNFLLRMPEVYLNKAEAEAMLGKEVEAKQTLQVLRSKRFKSADLTSVSETGEALVSFIRDERRRELCFEGHRWFDLRRYAVNSKYPYNKTIRHIVMENSGGVVFPCGYYELKPYAQDQAAYIIPIPSYAIVFNNGALTNFERLQRDMVVFK